MIWSLIALLVVTLPLAVFNWRRDRGRIRRAATFTREESVRILARLPFALLAATCLSELVPNEMVAAILGPETGLIGILAASLFGGLLPGGPIVSFPLVILFSHQGAGGPQVVSLLTGWSVYAVHRVVAYESPLMGWNFVALRFAASWFVPPGAGILAGLLAAASGAQIAIP